MIESDILPSSSHLNSVKLFLIITDITTFAVYAILGLQVFVLRKVPLHGSGALKYLFYFNIGISFIFETLLALIKPIILFPFAIVYPLGWLSPMKALPTLILSTFALGCLAIFLDILVSMLAQRYFFTRFMIKKDISKLQAVFYSILWGTNFISICSCIVILCCFSSSPKEVGDLIQLQHPIGGILLARQPSLTGFISYSSDAIIYFFRLVVAFAVSRFLAILCLTYLNYRLLSRNSENWTIKTQKMLQMFLKSIFAQAGVLVFAGGGPAMLAISLFIFPTMPLIQTFWMFAIWCAFAFSLFQTFAIIIFTPPFLTFLKKKCHLLWHLISTKRAIIRINHA